jgi:hypothetical protein
MLTCTQKSQKLFQNNYERITLDIKPVMLPFFTPFVVDIEKHSLEPYMAPVNHNVLNEKTWVNIVHTFMGNFYQETDNQNDTAPMEDVGHDDGVVVGYHKNVSVFTPWNIQQFPKWKTMLKIMSN